jgi:hypothetical protein
VNDGCTHLSKIVVLPFALLYEIVELGSEQLSRHVVISGALDRADMRATQPGSFADEADEIWQKL